MTTDPVCGMPFDEACATASVEYHGHTYYVCSVVCQEAFEADPSKFVFPADQQREPTIAAPRTVRQAHRAGNKSR